MAKVHGQTDVWGAIVGRDYETDEERKSRIATESAFNAQQQNASDNKAAIARISTFGQDYESKTPFQFDVNNPYITATKQIAGQAAEQTGEQYGKALASRGTQNSGQVSRAISATKQAQSGQIAGATQQSYLQQMQQYQTHEQQAFNQALTGYNLTTDQQKQIQDMYMQQAAIAQQKATQEYQQEQQTVQGIGQFAGNIAGMALGVPGLGSMAFGGGSSKKS